MLYIPAEESKTGKKRAREGEIVEVSSEDENPAAKKTASKPVPKPTASARTRLVLEISAARRRGKETAGAAIATDATTGKVVRQATCRLKEGTPDNEADYEVLLAGLKMVAGLRPTAVQVRLSNELVVNQKTGACETSKRELKELWQKASDKATALGGVSFVKVDKQTGCAAAVKLAKKAK